MVVELFTQTCVCKHKTSRHLPNLIFCNYLLRSSVVTERVQTIVFSDNISNTEDRFSNWRKTICSVTENLNIMLTQLGVDALEVSTHSFRKGVAEFLNSMIGSASHLSIYLRAGWSLGPVQSRNILEGQCSDQLCSSRAASFRYWYYYQRIRELTTTLQYSKWIGCSKFGRVGRYSSGKHHILSCSISSRIRNLLTSIISRKSLGNPPPRGSNSSVDDTNSCTNGIKHKDPPHYSLIPTSLIIGIRCTNIINAVVVTKL